MKRSANDSNFVVNVGVDSLYSIEKFSNPLGGHQHHPLAIVWIHHWCMYDVTPPLINMVTSQNSPLPPKRVKDKNGPGGKVKIAPRLFTNDTSSFNNRVYIISIWLLCKHMKFSCTMQYVGPIRTSKPYIASGSF